LGKRYNLCVMGLGYIGLPTASMFAAHGLNVLGVDSDPAVLSRIFSCRCPPGEPGLEEVLNEALNSGRLTLSQTPEPSEAYVLAVPTPHEADGRVDVSYLRAAFNAVSPLLRSGDLLVVESTVPPGTTETLILCLLRSKGLWPGVRLAHCPERVMPGGLLKEYRECDRIIGAPDEGSYEAAKHLYSRVVRGDFVRTDLKTAEAVKLIENTYRAVNIGFANEVALVCEALGINVWEAIALANGHPRVSILQPGLGVGGHCIGVDPHFLIHLVPDRTTLIQAAMSVNASMATHVAGIAWEMAGEPAPSVGILGLAYKENVADARESPALRFAASLRSRGATVRMHDPWLPDHPESLPLEAAVTDTDCLVLTVSHREFLSLDPSRIAPLVRKRRILDVCSRLERARWEAAGFTVQVLAGGRVELDEALREVAVTGDLAGETT